MPNRHLLFFLIRKVNPQSDAFGKKNQEDKNVFLRYPRAHGIFNGFRITATTA